MRFDVQAGRVRRTIDVRRSGTGWTVNVDGRVFQADLSSINGRWSLLLHDDDSAAAAGPRSVVAAASYEIGIERQPGGRQLVSVDGRTTVVTLRDPRAGADSRRAEGASGPGPVSIVSPMPGRVVKLLASPGQEVAERQGLVVIEAMKMENELRAPRPGRVTDIRVREGEAVDANTVLITLS